MYFLPRERVSSHVNTHFSIQGHFDDIFNLQVVMKTRLGPCSSFIMYKVNQLASAKANRLPLCYTLNS